MDNKERFEAQLKRHLSAIGDLYEELTGNKLNYFIAKKISNKLRRIEKEVSRISEDYSNGIYNNYEEIEPKLNKYKTDIKKLFNTDKDFVYINTDPRGYALKVNEDFFTNANLFTDWGGYKLLAPELPC